MKYENIVAFFENSSVYKERQIKGNKKRFVNVNNGSLYEVASSGVLKYSPSGKVGDLIEIPEDQADELAERGSRLS